MIVVKQLSTKNNKMEIKIKTSVKAIEVANMILGQGIKSIKDNPEIKKAFMLSETDLKNAEAFRKSLLKSFLKR